MIRFEPNSQRRFLGAVERLKDNLDRQAHTELPRRMAYEFKNILIENMSQQKFVAGWGSGASYNPEYRKWKYSALGGNLGFWFLKGDLLKSIKVWPLSTMGIASPKMSTRRSGAYLGGAKSRPYMVGIPAGKYDTGHKSWYSRPWEGDYYGKRKLIAMYAHVLEFGGDFRAQKGGKHPKRSVFTPSLIGYRRREARSTAGRTLRQIGRWSWRG
jgi:hypothetical protein